MSREVCVVLGLILVVPILGCMTTSRYVYQDEIVFDNLEYEVGKQLFYDGVGGIWQLDIICRAMNNNKTEDYEVDYQAFVTYTVEGVGTRTQKGELKFVELHADETRTIREEFEVHGYPPNFTQMTYGFTYGADWMGFLNRTIKPRRN